MKQQFFRAESFSKSFSFGSFVISSSSITFPNEKHTTASQHHHQQQEKIRREEQFTSLNT